jgi:hypothetical protein
VGVHSFYYLSYVCVASTVIACFSTLKLGVQCFVTDFHNLLCYAWHLWCCFYCKACFSTLMKLGVQCFVIYGFSQIRIVCHVIRLQAI